MISKFKDAWRALSGYSKLKENDRNGLPFGVSRVTTLADGTEQWFRGDTLILSMGPSKPLKSKQPEKIYRPFRL